MQTSKEAWKPRPLFIAEGYVRKAIQTLYDSVVFSLENSSLIADKPFTDLKTSKGFGMRETRLALRFFARWLVRFQQYAAASEMFNAQILEPARITANFRKEVADLSPSSTSIECFIFSAPAARSVRGFPEETRTVSMIVPELQCCLNLRHTVGILGKVGVGQYVVSGVIPVPYVNRIHPVRISVTPREGTVSVTTLDFLKVSFSDLEVIWRPIAFEELCIVESSQAGRQLLGIPCVLSGKLISVSGPQMLLGDSEGSRVLHLILSDDLNRAFPGRRAGLDLLQGKFVSVLVVLWYGRRPDAAAKIWPEAYWIEELSGQSAARQSDLAGYVRLRRKVPIDKLKELFPWLESGGVPPGLIVAGNSAHLVLPKTELDEVKKKFVESSARLADLRFDGIAKNSSYLSRVEEFLDYSKLRVEGLVSTMSSEKQLYDSFLAIVRASDNEGELGTFKEIRRLLPSNGSDPREILYWFRDVGLLQHQRGVAQEGRRDKRMTISTTGFNVITNLFVKEAAGRLEVWINTQGQVFSILSAQRAVGFPPSVVLQALRELEKRGIVTRARLQGYSFEFVWSKGKPATDLGEISTAADASVARVLTYLLDFPQGVSQRVIVSHLKSSEPDFGFFATGLILESLEKTGRVRLEVEKGGNKMWSYPMYARVKDAFSARSGKILTFPQLVQLTKARPMDTESLRNALRKLRAEGLLREGTGDNWAPSNLPDFGVRLVKSEVLEFVKRVVKEEGGLVDFARLHYEVAHHILDSIASYKSNFGVSWSESEAWYRADELIREFEASADIMKDGKKYRLTA